MSRQLACRLHFRDGFDNTSSIFENIVASTFSCEVLRHTRLQRLVQRLVVKVLVPQWVALVPCVREEVLGKVMLRDLDLGGAQLHVPIVEVVQDLQAKESNRNEHVEQGSPLPGARRFHVSRAMLA